MVDNLMKELNRVKTLLFFGALIWSSTIVAMDFHFVSETELHKLEVNKLIDKIADLDIRIKHATERERLMFEELKTRAKAELEKMKSE